MKLTILACLSLVTLISQLPAAVIFDRGASWKWRPGSTEASTPVEAWRTIGFNDSAFTTAPSPFYYGESLTGGTVISGMQNVYGSIFLRKTFVLNNVAEIGGLKLGAIVDDGFVAWINGTEVHRVNMAGGAGTAVTISTLALQQRDGTGALRHRDSGQPRRVSRGGNQRDYRASFPKRAEQQRPDSRCLLGIDRF